MASETRYGSTDINTVVTTNSGTSTFTSNWAQVIATHYSDLTLPVGTIRYKSLAKTSDSAGTATALYQSFKNTPVIGEVVLIIPGPKPGGHLRSVSGDYFLPALNMWNHPQSGIVSDGFRKQSPDPEWRETDDTNPLYPYAGDILIEGRKGQSIRLSESLRGTPWDGPTRNLSTIAIVSGVHTTGAPTEYVTEDINTDAASIYLLQNQKLPLEVTHQWTRLQDNKPITSYGRNTLPKDAKTYTGNQVVLNSDRLYLNASTEHVLISAQQRVGLLGDHIHLDGVKSINLAAPRVQLTTAARNPALRGSETITELENLYSRLASLTETLSDTLNSLNAPNDTVDELKEFLIGRLENDSEKLKSSLLSKTVYLD